MVPILLLCVLGVTLTHGTSVPRPSKSLCYVHYDLAAKYQLRHDKNYYPTNEINLILEKHPEMKSMFYSDDHPLPFPPSHYNPAPKPACPYKRFTLYSFFDAGKDCYVIYPDVQKIMYVQCSDDNNRDCQKCSRTGWGYDGVSKCEEDYDYRHVWAYCTQRHSITHIPDDTLVHVQPRREIQPPRIVIPKAVQQPKVQVYPAYPDNRGWGSKPYESRIVLPKKVVTPLDGPYKDPWGTLYRPYILQHRWKRSYHAAPEGKIERMKLFLPHHCGCKKFTC